MGRWLGIGLMAIAVLAAANIASALTVLGSSSVNLSGLRFGPPAHGFVDLIPKEDAHAIPVRLRLSGELWLSGFGRRDWFTGVIETEELEILAWERPHNPADIRIVLHAQSDEFDPAETIRFAFRDGKAERLEEYDGLRTYRLVWYENSIEIRMLGDPETDRFAAIVCFQHGCYTDIRIGPNLMGRLSLPDIRKHGGRDYANRVIADVGRKVCNMLVDAICWADR
jgi:hypothetical protein